MNEICQSILFTFNLNKIYGPSKIRYISYKQHNTGSLSILATNCIILNQANMIWKYEPKPVTKKVQSPKHSYSKCVVSC